MLDVISPRSLRVLTAGVAIPSLLMCGAPSAAADSTTHGVAVCHSSQDSGVEVDTCTGNPNANDDANSPGEHVRVEFCIGLGFGGCDD